MTCWAGRPQDSRVEEEHVARQWRDLDMLVTVPVAKVKGSEPTDAE